MTTKNGPSLVMPLKVSDSAKSPAVSCVVVAFVFDHRFAFLLVVVVVVVLVFLPNILFAIDKSVPRLAAAWATF